MPDNKNNNIELNTTIKDYTILLSQLAEQNSSLIFENKGPEHASAVISKILDTSEHEVFMFAKNMNGGISNYGKYMKSIRKYIDQGKTLNILIHYPNEIIKTPLSPLLQLIKNKQLNSNVAIKAASTEFLNDLEAIVVEKRPYYFTIGDKKMIRLETNNEAHIAPVCSFNLKGISTVFSNVFTKHFSECKEILL